METIKLRSRTDQNGTLHLEIPVDLQNTDLEVTITFIPIQSGDSNKDELGWSEGFFDRTAGAWIGEPLGELSPTDEDEPKSQILADLQASIRASRAGEVYPVSQLWDDTED